MGTLLGRGAVACNLRQLRLTQALFPPPLPAAGTPGGRGGPGHGTLCRGNGDFVHPQIPLSSSSGDFLCASDLHAVGDRRPLQDKQTAPSMARVRPLVRGRVTGHLRGTRAALSPLEQTQIRVLDYTESWKAPQVNAQGPSPEGFTNKSQSTSNCVHPLTQYTDDNVSCAHFYRCSGNVLDIMRPRGVRQGVPHRVP
jgi:hypothetical protein